MNRDYNYRKYKRYVKGIKRIKADRAEHGNDHSCDCFCPDADRGKGATFSKFADNPKICSNPFCCGNVPNDGRYIKKSWQYYPQDDE